MSDLSSDATTPPLKYVLEAALLAAGETLSLARLLQLFGGEHTDSGADTVPPDADAVRAALDELTADYAGRAIELVELGGGYRIQVRQSYAGWVGKLWEERPGHYSRALLETLALIAYRQPITRGEIAEVRGVSVSTGMIRTLLERGWIKVVGQREVPGRPSLYGTTREFLDYFNLKSLSELPPLAEPRDLAVIGQELAQRPELAPASAVGEDAYDAGPAPAPDGPDETRSDFGAAGFPTSDDTPNAG